jgi:hypothetical protein
VIRWLSLATALFAAALILTVPAPALAQDDDDPAAVKLAEPDFALISMPTSLRVPAFSSAFRVTHRFTRPLNDTFGDVAGDLFGLDSGAVIGLEYRFGIVPNGQIGLHRSSSKTIEFFGQYQVLPQRRSGVDISAFVSVEGTNNFRDSYSPAVGAIVSRAFGTRAALYAEPIWINNTNELPQTVVDHNDTFMVGLGARLRVRPSVYVVMEATPRIAGYRPNITQAGIAIEKRAGGHLFQLNVTNGFGTTMAHIARGAAAENDWHLGFSIARKFFD